MVSHANLLANLAMIARAFGNTSRSTHVSWVPLYHDMGLIINALQSLYVGAACVLMTPVAFVQRPLIWLRAISDYRAEVAGGPNFAFDLCVERYRPEQMDGDRPVRLEGGVQRRRTGARQTIRRFSQTYASHGFAARRCCRHTASPRLPCWYPPAIAAPVPRRAPSAASALRAGRVAPP